MTTMGASSRRGPVSARLSDTVTTNPVMNGPIVRMMHNGMGSIAANGVKTVRSTSRSTSTTNPIGAYRARTAWRHDHGRSTRRCAQTVSIASTLSSIAGVMLPSP